MGSRLEHPVRLVRLVRLVHRAVTARAEHPPDDRKVTVRHPVAQERPVGLVGLVGLVRLEIPRPLLGAEPMRLEWHLERRESRLELLADQFVRA